MQLLANPLILGLYYKAAEYSLLCFQKKNVYN